MTALMEVMKRTVVKYFFTISMNYHIIGKLLKVSLNFCWIQTLQSDYPLGALVHLRYTITKLGVKFVPWALEIWMQELLALNLVFSECLLSYKIHPEYFGSKLIDTISTVKYMPEDFMNDSLCRVILIPTAWSFGTIDSDAHSLILKTIPICPLSEVLYYGFWSSAAKHNV